MKGAFIERLVEDGWVVTGTTDMEIVKDLLLDEDEVRDEAPEDVDWDIFFTVLKIGLMRKVPCSPSGCGEHGWHLHTNVKPGRGAFLGVWVDDVHYNELEYACDID